MNILSIYGSNTGNTESLMLFIKDIYHKSKCNFKLINAKNSNISDKANNFSNYDVIILSSPTWGGRSPTLQEDFEAFWKNLNKEFIANNNFAVIGLGDIYYPSFCKAVDFISDDIVKYNGRLVINSLALPDPWENHKLVIEAWAKKLITKFMK